MDIKALLGEAMLVEHSLIASYLYAAYSLKHLADGDERKGIIDSWRSELTNIAKEEMVHLAIVQRLARLVGRSTYIERPGFPFPLGYKRKDGQTPELFFLKGFSLDALKWFISIEGGYNAPLIFNEGYKPPLLYSTIKELYEAIKDELRGPGLKIYDVPDFFHQDDLWGHNQSGNIPAIFDIATAISAINIVITQSEGSSPSDPNSHVQRLVKLYVEADAFINTNPGYVLVENVISNPAISAQSQIGSTPIPTGTLSFDLALLHAQIYSCLLSVLSFSHEINQAEAQYRQAIIGVALSLMASALGSLGKVISRHQFSPDDNRTSGPSFEYIEMNIGNTTSFIDVIARIEAAILLTKDHAEKIQGQLDSVPVTGLSSDTKKCLSKVMESCEFAASQCRDLRDKLKSPAPPGPDPVFPVMQIFFSGWFMCRLGTAGAPKSSGRGEGGWTFAIEGEPDLDGIIRFHLGDSQSNLQRSLVPKVGIWIDSISNALGKIRDLPNGARVELLHRDGSPPTFESWGILKVKEPIEPFRIRFVCGDSSLTLEASRLTGPTDPSTAPRRPEMLEDSQDPRKMRYFEVLNRNLAQSDFDQRQDRLETAISYETDCSQ